ncbi:putative Serine-type D-Ala-D-Ala carboxypeptidase [Hyphomicrobium sp. GJ21]|jgi:D-alanyl-D-alanine carboxypeptidase (penicillin-binding protein 5/6)|uniref:D-alanyl-D-alanine carboxypeptidase family protein n=1 Tax=Hyphomicrobium sp. GJ21 TaxID=113574 RepID=UPI000622B46C|nr:D-alanyl-D-alanine carboxypeptidase family protein [Hyphomicrobium sp. GJ21]MBN9352906.1 D-alanyl-D-alanine carboxypeptidase [Hyphomicrobium denitrificans]CEJ84949.1 putative Serine-type D-Ala-D-Ala carboxypeptidase [Hyphomicrobium sp. GJ21]
MLTQACARLLVSALIAISVLTAVGPEANPALAAEAAFTSKAPRAILIDAATGATLFQQHADEPAPPASMSKLMTVAVLFRAMKEGRIQKTDEFTMSVNAWRNGGAPSGTSAMMVPVNTKVTVDELIQGIVIQSGNDAAMCVAEGMAGSIPAFARMMNDEAKRIGLTKSTFTNASGLPDPQQLMSARDLAVLARYIIDEYPDYYPVFAQKEFLYRKHRFINRNPLLFQNIGADGLKTGHTAAAGFGLVGSAVQDGKRLIVVVSGLEKADQRKEEAVKLLNWGFNSFNTVRLYDANEVIGQARVWGGKVWYVPLAANADVTFTVPKFPANQKISAEIVYKAPLKPPVKKGDQVATLKLSSSTSASTELPLYATEDVQKGGIVREGLDSLVLMALRRLAF